MANPIQVDFAWTPVSGVPFTWLTGGNSYPYTTQQDAVSRASDTRYAAVLTSTNTALTFTATVVTPANLTVIEYRWDFGDGVIAYGPIVGHTYTMPSPQTAVSLVVTDNLFQQSSRQRLLNLRAGSKIVFGMPLRVVG